MNNTMIRLIDSMETNEIGTALNKIATTQAVIKRALKKDHDYGEIPGTNKPTLLKPGAEKILMMFGIRSEYEIITQIEDWEKGIFAYTIRCILSHGAEKITEGLGSCNSKEDRYRYRWVKIDEVPEGIDTETLKTRYSEYGTQYNRYRIENDETYSQANTILKMAKKRAQVDATLTVASLSEIFTQDIEDMKEFTQREKTFTVNENTAGNLIIPFGKFKGDTLDHIQEVEPTYVEWLAQNAKQEDVRKAAEIVYNKGQEEENEEEESESLEGTPFA